MDQLPPSFHPETCSKQGLITVGNTKDKIYFELHDSPAAGVEASTPDRVLLICGMYSTSAACLHTVRHLTEGSAGKYSILVLDNRGAGASVIPRRRFKTSDMAQDVVALLDHVGWTQDRTVHIVGISLGGMVAQEVALAVPRRLASLILTSSRAGPIPELPTLQVGRMLALQISGRVRGPAHGAALAVGCLFPEAFLDQPDPKEPGSTRREVLEREYLRKALEGGPGSAAGKLGQFFAVTTHYVSPKKLATVLSTIPRVHIIVGELDQLIAPRRSRQLYDMIPGSTFRLVEGGGHTLPLQFEEEYHKWLTDVFTEAKVIIAGTSQTPSLNEKAEGEAGIGDSDGVVASEVVAET